MRTQQFLSTKHGGSPIVAHWCAFLMVFLVTACQTAPLADGIFGDGSTLSETSPQPIALSETIPDEALTTTVRQLAYDGIKALETEDLERASRSFNLALKYDVRNSYLQFLNAMTYHLRGLQGDAQDLTLAKTGYRIAQDFDPTNWLAAFYEGLLHADTKNWRAAQDSFARALLLDRENPDILYQLAKSSYYARDLETALSALNRLEAAGVEEKMAPKLTRALAVTNAGANQPDRARDYFERYKEHEPNKRQIKRLSRRLNSWASFHSRHVRGGEDMQLAQFALPSADDEDEAEDNSAGDAEDSFSNETPDEPDEAESVFSPPPSEDEEDNSAAEDKRDIADAEQEEELPPEDQNPMVVVDVVIIRTEDDISTSNGINLLTGLQLQFGDPLNGTPGFGYVAENIEEFIDPTDTEKTRTITKSISVPAVTYSLNIANAADGRNEILARPTLVAMPGETSEFFSGVEVNAAAVSGGDGDSVSIDKEIGVKLSVRPELLEDNLVRLDVEAERTFLTTPSNSIIFEFRIDTTKTSINAAVTMGFGQTLILGGLSERERENNLDGVPYIRNVPLLRRLFSTETTRDFNKSVLILITPRRAISIDKDEEAFERQLRAFTDREGALERLSYAYRDWFKPTSNVEKIFQHMNSNDLYVEFKTGDFRLESWQRDQEHTARLSEALDYLFY